MKYRNRILAFVLALIVMATTIGYQINTTIRANELEDTPEEATQEEVQTEQIPTEPETTASGADIEIQVPQAESVTQAPETTAPETEAETPISEATELRQDFTDGISIIANLPEGAFEAATSDITMQVNGLTSAQLTYITSLMDKEIDKDTYEVGDYVIFDIKFLVNGVETEPLEEVTVNIKNSKINVGDVESAKVFYFDPHDASTSSDDELVEISQRSLLIKEFQKAGRSTANIDDYDLSNIILNDKGKATEINFEARKNTIYGCYVVNEIEKESETTTPETEVINKEETELESETEAESESESEAETEKELYITDFTNQTLDYEDAQVKISVEAVEENAIPEEASLSVTPIVKDSSDTQAQYEAVERLLQRKAENEDYDIAGFLAYDITLVDEFGNKVEPNGEVKVTMNYKQAVIADEAVQTVENTDGLESTADLGITVMHLEEDEHGNVAEVVDMTEANKADIAATEDGKVEKTEITTDSFSTYAVTWTSVVNGLNTVDTVDSTSDGITMRLIDYTNYTTQPYDTQNSIYIGGGNYGYGNIKQNLVQRILSDGYPLTAAGTSLSSLFSGGKSVNHLFLQSTYDSDGVYEYSSFENYAYMNTDGNFTVYDALGTPSNTGSDSGDGNGYFFYKRGNFLPYNNISSGNVSANKNYYDEYGNKLADNSYGKTLYLAQNSVNYQFGLYLQTYFLQPKDGVTKKNADMVYEFNGDDDMWVYVDGVLMLDIGGVHDAHSGSINFATGVITVYDTTDDSNKLPITRTTTIKDQFKVAGIFPDGTTWDDSKTDKYFDGNTFRDNTSHDMKMFYMERGRGASNLHVKFNLEVIKEYPVEFKKVNTSDTGLSGAEFEITNDETEETITATSGSDGLVSLVLPVGTYTMKETVAPDGYMRNTDKWAITVNDDGSYTFRTEDGAELGKTDDIYRIINKTENENVESSLEVSKTAEVTDYDKREYQINLTAGIRGATKGQAASVVLVLDRSSSMGNDGMTNLVTAAEEFIDTLKSATPDSQLAVVYFNGIEGESGTTQTQGFTKLNSSANVTTIKNFLENNKSPSSATPMGDALKEAYNLLSADETDNEQYVVFFTDGMPGYKYSYDIFGNENPSASDERFNCKVANNAVNYATKIKEKAILYTVGYNLSESFKWHLGDSASSDAADQHGGSWSWSGFYNANHTTTTSATDFLKNYIATSASNGNTYAYTVNDTTALQTKFEELAEIVSRHYALDAEKIVDVIDARFKLTEDGRKALVGDVAGVSETDSDGNVITTYTKTTTNANGNTGTVKITENADGTTTIEWTGTEAHIGNKDNKDDPVWQRTIDICAKDDFIGGNAITTNVGSSGIYLKNNKTNYFPKPTVNVKALSLTSTGKEITVYKGDQVLSSTFYGELGRTIKVNELVNDASGNPMTTLTGVLPGAGDEVSLPTLTQEQIVELNRDKTLTIGDEQTYKYIYPGTTDAVGYMKYTYTISETPGGNAEDHAAGDAASPAEKYTLKAEFVPYTVDERINANTGLIRPDTTVPSGKTVPRGGTEISQANSNLETSSDYIVNIIDGSVEITKVLDTEPKNTDGDTFTFTVTGSDGFNKEISLTVRSSDKDEATGKYTVTYTGDDLKHLARGSYTITENSVQGYDVESIANDDSRTNTKYVLNSLESMTFTLGTVTKDDQDSDVIKNYTYDANDGGTLGKVIFTNTAAYTDWKIIKVSASSHDLKIGGAIFELRSATSDSDVTFYGASQTDTGLVNWYQTYQDGTVSDQITKLPAGAYTLKEIKAPDGYALSNEIYTLEITNNGSLKTIRKGDTEVTPEADPDGTYQILIENTAVYVLPSAGGLGIYWYIIDGILCMLLASLMDMKKWREEVFAK